MRILAVFVGADRHGGGSDRMVQDDIQRRGARLILVPPARSDTLLHLAYRICQSLLSDLSRGDVMGIACVSPFAINRAVLPVAEWHGGLMETAFTRTASNRRKSIG